MMDHGHHGHGQNVSKLENSSFLGRGLGQNLKIDNGENSYAIHEYDKEIMAKCTHKVNKKAVFINTNFQ